MAEFSPRPKVGDGIAIAGSVCVMGAPAAFPQISHAVGLILFYGGLAGVIAYPAWRWGWHYAIEAANSRISAFDLREMAVSRGWPAVVEGDNNDPRWFDFLNQLRQAASDKRIPVWGRDELRNASGRYGKRTMIEPLISIPADYWNKFQIEPSSFLSGRAERTRTYDLHHKTWGHGERYNNLHFGKREAKRLLRSMRVPQK